MLTVSEKEQTWMKRIVAYIVNGIVLPDKLEARKLRTKSARYCIFEEIFTMGLSMDPCSTQKCP